MPDRYDALIQRLLDACNLDGDLLPGLHEDAIVALIKHKVGEGDERIAKAQEAVEHWRETAEIENTARGVAEAERDSIVALLVKPWPAGGCVVRLPIKPSGYYAGGVLCDNKAGDGDFYHFWAREHAIAAVRKAAGLEDAR